jgi:hypothetical protein
MMRGGADVFRWFLYTLYNPFEDSYACIGTAMLYGLNAFEEFMGN